MVKIGLIYDIRAYMVSFFNDAVGLYITTMVAPRRTRSVRSYDTIYRKRNERSERIMFIQMRIYIIQN